jgi:hypothetical protein
MSSPWRTRKAILYFGGAFIILLGGAIVLIAPYNYLGYRAGENQSRAFTLTDRSGYYPELEISVTCHPDNTTPAVLVDFAIRNNATAQITWLNFTLTELDMVPGTNPPSYVSRQTTTISPGAYTVIAVRVEGTTILDVGLTQSSDSRLFIVTGGSLNILGLFMGIAGYFVAGTFLPTGDDIIVDWGYDEEIE